MFIRSSVEPKSSRQRSLPRRESKIVSQLGFPQLFVYYISNLHNHVDVYVYACCVTHEYMHMHRREQCRYIIGQELMCVGILMSQHYAAVR
jgi:hypothetical protein